MELIPRHAHTGIEGGTEGGVHPPTNGTPRYRGPSRGVPANGARHPCHVPGAAVLPHRPAEVHADQRSLSCRLAARPVAGGMCLGLGCTVGMYRSFWLQEFLLKWGNFLGLHPEGAAKSGLHVCLLEGFKGHCFRVQGPVQPPRGGGGVHTKTSDVEYDACCISWFQMSLALPLGHVRYHTELWDKRSTGLL